MAPEATTLAAGAVLPGEEKDLGLHVAICAQRNAEIIRMQDAANTRLKRIEYGVYLIGAAILGAAGVGIREILPILQAVATIAGATAGTPPIALPILPGIPGG